MCGTKSEVMTSRIAATVLVVSWELINQKVREVIVVLPRCTTTTAGHSSEQRIIVSYLVIRPLKGK